MYLSAIAAQHFRNLETFRMAPDPRFNIIEGKNGQGKTNLLELIYMLATFKSQRNAKNKELIRFEENEAQVLGEVHTQYGRQNVALWISPKGKKVKVNDKIIPQLSKDFHHLSAVIFGPDDLRLSKDGPELRRQFLDRASYAIWPQYLQDMSAYQQALKHRNRLLSEARFSGLPPNEDMLSSFEAELARYGSKIQTKRTLFLEAFYPLFQEMFRDITKGALKVKIVHEKNGLSAESLPLDELEERYLALYHAKRKSDLQRGFTQSGPHRDDLIFYMDGHLVRSFASQGQHRVFVLALKMAELERIRKEMGEYPVFLLDDVSSELDEERNALLMKRLDESQSQVFITTTDRRWIKMSQAALWKVDGGQITKA